MNPPPHSAPTVTCVEPEAAVTLAMLHARAFETPWTAAELTQTMASPGAFALAIGAPALGFVLARAVAGEAEILTLAVDSGVRRTGLGRALVDAAARHALAEGADALWLEVAEDNVAALALYAAAGFEAVGRRRGYYARPGGAADALCLRRRLNTAPA